MNEATSSKVFSGGTPLNTAVAAFTRLVDLLGPFTIAVIGGGRHPSHLRDLLGLHGDRSRVVAVDEDLDVTSFGFDWCVVEASELLVSMQEAARLADGRVPLDELRDLLGMDSRYVPFVAAMRSRVGLPPLWAGPQEMRVSEAVGEFGLDPVILAEALVRRERHVEAFELMCSNAKHLIPRYVEVCGEAYFERGLFEQFWHQINQVGSESLEHEQVLRWYYAGAMAVNRHAKVVPVVEAFLRVHEAPELRAQYAASRPSREFLSETTRAVEALESPITLRHHAFALSLSGANDRASDVLQRALRLADVLGNDQMVVAIGTDMCTLLQRVGALRESLWWGEWTCGEYVRRELGENLRLVSVQAALAFSKMLVGEEVGLAELIGSIELSTGLVGVPSYEGVVSTVADYFSVFGSLDSAIELYQMLFENSTYDEVGMVSVDYVKCLVAAGQVDRALDVSERVYVLSRAASKFQSDCGSLARGIALKGACDARATEFLQAAVEAFLDGADAVRLSQACVHLADLRILEGDTESAQALLAPVSNVLNELGHSGWHVIGGRELASVERVKELVSTTPAGLSLHALGPQSATLFAGAVEFTPRQTEILVVLAHSPSGLSLEALSDRLYGDRAVQGTTKALVSRLRSTIPLTSRPYRIGVPFRADFLELLEHLKRGRVRQALGLYKGRLLPASQAPAIVELRDHIDESLRQAVLQSADPEAMLELANRTDAGDLELLEAAYRHLPRNDPQSPLVRARIRQIRRDWSADSEVSGRAEWR